MPPSPSPALVTKIKVQLKLAIARLRMVQQRDEAMSKIQRRAMAQLLDQGKLDSARIRVENIIRSDITTELHEILELYCELLLARAGLLDAPTCDAGLEEAVKSIIYAAPKTEIKELQQVRLLLGEKFGKEFVLRSMENADGKVSDKVVKKLSLAPPKEELVTGYLEVIAKAYGMNWPREAATGEGGQPQPQEHEAKDLGAPPKFVDDMGSGADVLAQAQNDESLPAYPGSEAKAKEDELSQATPPRSLKPSSPFVVNPPSPSTEDIQPKLTLNSAQITPLNQKLSATAAKAPALANSPKISDGIPDVDELAKRFAALKR